MVVTQYRCLLVSLRREWSSVVSRIRRARGYNGGLGPGTSGRFPHITAPPTYCRTPDLRKGLWGLDRPPDSGYPPDGLTSLSGSVCVGIGGVGIGGGRGGGSGRSGCRWIGAPCSCR